MILSSGVRAGFILFLALTSLLVGLHFAGDG
jgi:hypothetical protein